MQGDPLFLFDLTKDDELACAMLVAFGKTFHNIPLFGMTENRAFIAVLVRSLTEKRRLF